MNLSRFAGVSEARKRGPRRGPVLPSMGCRVRRRNPERSEGSLNVKLMTKSWSGGQI